MPSSLLHFEVFASHLVEVCAEDRLVHNASIRDRLVDCRVEGCSATDGSIQVVLLGMIFVVTGRRVIKELLLDDLLDSRTVTVLIIVRVEHLERLMFSLWHLCLILVVIFLFHLVDWYRVDSSKRHEQSVAKWRLWNVRRHF